MGQEPSRFISDLKDAVQLMRADALFRRGHQINRLKHLVQRDMGAFKDRSDLDRKLLAAIRAFAKTDAGFAKIIMLAAQRAAMRADRTLGPKDAFEIFKGFGFIVKVELGQNGHGSGSISNVKSGYVISVGL